jgi:hypothetical protein
VTLQTQVQVTVLALARLASGQVATEKRKPWVKVAFLYLLTDIECDV